MTCIVCGQSSWARLYSAHDRMFGFPGTFTELRCLECGLVRVDPMPTFTQMSRYYPKQYYSYLANAKPSIMWHLRTYLIAHSNKSTLLAKILNTAVHIPAIPEYVSGGKILDVGCGSGETLALLSRIGWNAYGMDIDADALKIAKKRGLAHVTVGSYKDMVAYPDSYFDAIRLYHVIEHLDNPAACIHIAYKKLKPNGELIIGTPNIDSLVAKLAKQDWFNLDCPRHVYLFSPKTLRALFIKNKFKNLQITFCSGGGWIGSIQYMLADIVSIHLDLIKKPWVVIFFYPIEWLLDRAGVGDIFVLRARK